MVVAVAVMNVTFGPNADCCSSFEGACDGEVFPENAVQEAERLQVADGLDHDDVVCDHVPAAGGGGGLEVEPAVPVQ